MPNHSLRLSDENITSEELTKALSDTSISTIFTDENLWELNLSLWNKLDHAIRQLPQNHELNELKLAKVQLNRSTILAICDFVKSDNRFNSFAFSDVNIPDAGIGALSTAFQTNRSVTHLDFSWASLGRVLSEKTTDSFVQLIKSNHILQQLSFTCDLSAPNFSKIATAINENSTLQHVNIKFPTNEALCSALTSPLAKLIEQNQTLSSLTIPMTTSNATEILAALEKNKTLTQFKSSYPLDEKIQKQVDVYINRNKQALQNIHRKSWMMFSILSRFNQANSGNVLRDSIFPLVPSILSMSDMEVDLKQNKQNLEYVNQLVNTKLFKHITDPMAVATHKVDQLFEELMIFKLSPEEISTLQARIQRSISNMQANRKLDNSQKPKL